MKLSIVIPAFNEEKTVSKILWLVGKLKLPNRVGKEIIVVNDGFGWNEKLEQGLRSHRI